MTKLLSVNEAQRSILAVFKPLEAETAPLAACAGRVLCEDIHATIDLPPFTNSSMDGYAVRAGDTTPANRDHPVALRVAAEAAAGVSTTHVLQPGEAIRIMTGAPLPEGADAVIPVEETRDLADGRVEVLRAARGGDYLRPRGMDMRAGQPVLARGHKLRPQDLGMLAMLGLADAPVYRRPRVALLSSGDELVEPGQSLMPGQIYDSNRFALGALVESQGAELIALGSSPDERDEVINRLEAAVNAKADVIVSSAGVSVGAYDFVRQVLQKNGHMMLWRVDMRPGKPVAFGRYRGVPVIGLPGNPVSAFVTFLVFVTPVLRKLQGLGETLPRREKATLTRAIESDGRESYLRGSVQTREGGWVASVDVNQSSGNLYSLVQANALLIVPSGVKSLPIGAQVEFMWLGE